MRPPRGPSEGISIPKDAYTLLCLPKMGHTSSCRHGKCACGWGGDHFTAWGRSPTPKHCAQEASGAFHAPALTCAGASWAQVLGSRPAGFCSSLMPGQRCPHGAGAGGPSEGQPRPLPSAISPPSRRENWPERGTASPWSHNHSVAELWGGPGGLAPRSLSIHLQELGRGRKGTFCTSGFIRIRGQRGV